MSAVATIGLMPKRPRGRPPADNPLTLRIMFRAEPSDGALLDELVERLRAAGVDSPTPSSPPTRGSVIRWLIKREAKARGIVVADPTSRNAATRQS